MCSIISFNNSFIYLTQWSNVNTKLIKLNKLFLCINKEASTRWLPKLKALVSKDSVFILVFWIWNIKNCDIVRIQINGFVRQNKLFVHLFHVSEDINVRISNIKLVLQLYQEMEIIRILFMEHNTEESELVMVSVCHYVEHLILIVINNLFNWFNSIFFI